MNELLNNIRSGGHWRVLIRPSVFEEERIGDSSLLINILERNFVQYRGHGFPFVDSNSVAAFNAGICQETEEGLFAEFWRFYNSGQFIHYSSFIEDRLDKHKGLELPENWQSETALDPKQVIFRCTEIFEFAARLSFSAVADEQSHIEISASHIEGRALRSLTDDSSIVGKHTCTDNEMSFASEYSNAQLLVDTRELALEPIQKLFNCFGRQIHYGLLKDMQAELLRNAPPILR